MKRHELYNRLPACFLAIALATAPATAVEAQGVPGLQVIPNSTLSVSPEALKSLQIEPPADMKMTGVDGAVMLSGRTLSSQLPKMQVLRQLNFSTLQQQPVIGFSLGKLNFQPLLADPKAPFNVAQKLRTLPALATVQADVTTAWEVKDGLVIHSLVRYALKSGACTNPTHRQQIQQAGVACSTRLSETELERRSQEFRGAGGRPGRLHEWAAQQRELRAKQLSAIQGHLGQLRAYFNDPAQRAKLVQELGQREVQRLAGLDNDALITEIANTGETVIEQAMFVPTQDTLNGSIPGLTALLKAKDKNYLLYLPGNGSSPPAGTQYQPASQTLPERHFLTGFTLGREYEWRQRIEKTVKWCLLGCAETYYVEAYARFGYGLGLRFAIKTWGTYAYLGKDKAEVTINFAPVNGHPNNFLEAGLPEQKLFQGKEIVAEASAAAGLAVKLPVIGATGIHPSLKVDFTEYLPGMFNGGQFTPPVPGSQTPPQTKVIDQIDFLNNAANFGVVGAKVHPALALSLKSGGLTLSFNDNLAGGAPKLLTASTSKIPLQVRPTDQSSNFTLGDPIYSVVFVITPGINARLFLDLAVWSTSWDHQIFFPQLEIELPPGGLKFGCHAETKCSRAYALGPTTPIKEQALAEVEQAIAEVQAYYNGYGAPWLKQCYDGACLIEVSGLVIQMVQWVKTYANTKPASWKAFNAQVEAGYIPLLQKAIDDSKNRTGGVKKI